MATPSKILIAPLDWGLGHTTRCIPIIRYLTGQGHDVYAAAEGASAALLRENFPSLKLIPLQGYRIQYSRSGALFVWKILTQVPRILSAIRKEHRWLKALQQEHQFDLILSDNRYGLYLKGPKTVILTHQLQIMSGSGKWADYVLRRLHYRMLNRFTQCWAVDEQAGSGFSGKLAHPPDVPACISYTGLLSQFSNQTGNAEQITANRILILLSGPEPMRGQLEQLLLQQARALTGYRFIVVGGNPLGQALTGLPEHISYHTHLAAAQLLPELQQAALVICRSGYSTVMDLVVLNKKALLLPTPGQTEQEYLASYLSEQGYFTTCSQKAVNLSVQIPEALDASLRPSLAAESSVGLFLDAILKDK